MYVREKYLFLNINDIYYILQFRFLQQHGPITYKNR